MHTYSVNNVLSSPIKEDQWKIASRNQTISSFPSNTPIQDFSTLNDDFRNRPKSPFSRLDRYKPKSPMIPLEPAKPIISSSPSLQVEKLVTDSKASRLTDDHVHWTWWSGSAFLLTCFIPNYILSTCGKKKSNLIQQAWREKVK